MSAFTSSRSVPRSGATLWQRLKNLFIAEVPQDIAICEFNCARTQCTHGQWETCQRRIDLTSADEQN